MTPSDIAAELRRLERIRTGARMALIKAEEAEIALLAAHADSFPFTLRGNTYEAWTTRTGRAYVRVTKEPT